MTTEIVHPVPRDDVDGWVRTMATTFLADPGAPRANQWVARVERDWQPERAWGARDRGRWVATLRTVPRTLTVPGADAGSELVVADALTNVTVAATHRRRGLLSAMLNASLREGRERGDPVSILIAAEWPIYGRFGYAPAALGARYVLHSSRQGCVIEGGDTSRVRQVDRDTFADLAPRVYGAARMARPGQVDRDGDWWDRALGRGGWPEVDELPHNWLIHEGEDGPDGLLAWRAVRDAGLIPPLGRVEVWLLAAAGAGADRDLWAYLTGLDLVDEVVLTSRPVDEPVRWLLRDARTLVMAEQVDFLWLRLLDVPAALAARRYGTAGDLVLEVTDDSAVSVAGRYRLSADAAGAACEPSSARPDLTLTQRALSAIYLGGFGLRQQTIAGVVTEHTSGALARADVMFATPRAPWNATSF